MQDYFFFTLVQLIYGTSNVQLQLFYEIIIDYTKKAK